MSRRRAASSLVPARAAKEVWCKIIHEQWLALLHEVAPDGRWETKGPHIKGRCVDRHHHDDNPSLLVTPGKGLAHCFSCTGSGSWLDPIAFVAEAKRVSYIDAAKFLRARFNLKALLPEDQLAKLEREDFLANQRTLAAKVMCRALLDVIEARDAIKAGAPNAPYWAMPALEWLEARRFGGDLAAVDWSRLTEQQMIGVVPPRGHVSNTYGEGSLELAACTSALREHWTAERLGWIVFPWHDVSRRVRRIKLRQPSLDAKNMITIDVKEGSDLWPGAYGLRAARLGGETPPRTIIIVEGEPCVLQLHASADVGIGGEVLAMGGGSAPSLDALAPLGVEVARVVQDNDSGGINFVETLAQETSAIALRPFAWPEEWMAPDVKDLDDVIVKHVVLAPRHVERFKRVTRVVVDAEGPCFVDLASWCVERAAYASRQLYEDSYKGRGDIAKRWGKLLRDTQDVAAYVREVAEQLEIDAATLTRDLGVVRGGIGEFTVDDEGFVLPTIENVYVALGALGVTVSYNEMARVELIDGLERFGPLLDDAALRHLRIESEKRFGLRMPSQQFYDVVVDHARARSIHGVRDYLAALPSWDGSPRIDTWLIDYAGAPDGPYVRAVSRMFLIAAVRRVRQPGVKFDEMPILESAQGTNKSTALRTLCKDPAWYTDDIQLDADEKTLLEKTLGYWIVEAGELTGLSRGDVNRLKAWLSRTTDNVRLSYDRRPSAVPREFVIVGSTNAKRGYLKDPTGNRRFLPVRVQRFDVDGLAAVRDQLWAEAADAEAQGASIRLAPELWADAAAEQADRARVDTMEVVLGDVLGDRTGKLKVTDAMRIVDIDLAAPSTQIERLDDAMEALGWERVKQLRFAGDRAAAYARGTTRERQREIKVEIDSVYGNRKVRLLDAEDRDRKQAMGDAKTEHESTASDDALSKGVGRETIVA